MERFLVGYAGYQRVPQTSANWGALTAFSPFHLQYIMQNLLSFILFYINSLDSLPLSYASAHHVYLGL